MKLKNLILKLTIGIVFSIITTMSFAMTLKSGSFTGSNTVKETLKQPVTSCHSEQGTGWQQCVSVSQCRSNANQEVTKYGGSPVYQCNGQGDRGFCYAGSSITPGGIGNLLPSRLDRKSVV